MRKEYFDKLIEKNILLRNVDRLTFLEYLEHKNKLLYSINKTDTAFDHSINNTPVQNTPSFQLRSITLH